MAETTPPSDETPIDPVTDQPVAAGTGEPKPPKSKKRRLIELSTVILLVAAGVAAFWWFHRPSAQPASVTVMHPAKPTPSPTPQPADILTGLPDTSDVASRPITGVVIENQTLARPQSGLSQADVVYEALAEGGITRYFTLFHSQGSSSLGPVRSIRTYFVDWALENDAPVAHAGGNADALDLIGPLGLKNMDQFTNGAYFTRAGDRYAPHNLYTSSGQLANLEQALGFNKPTAAKPLATFKSDQPAASPAHPTIDIDFSYAGYQVEYKYDPATDSYLRYLAGQPDIDRNTGQQIRVKNVVAEMMPTSFGFTRIQEQTVIMQTVGTGQAVVFRDGEAVVGTWKKDSHGDRTQLLDSAGKPIALNRGNTWFAIIPIDNQKRLSY